MLQPIASCRIRWLTAAEGGRRSPLPGSIHAATARFVEGSELFSVVLRSPKAAKAPLTEQNEIELNLLAPDCLPEIAARIVPRGKLQITEGARTVAECEVTSVRMAEVEPPFADKCG